jgi:hypothetical protein
METVEQKEKLREMVTRLYEECEVNVEPLYPKILIRVLPKEQKKGSIWLPDGKAQNKPTWEGIVLKVYKPFYRKIYLTEAFWVVDDPDPEVRYTQKAECAYQPGDHILFPHIEIGEVPVWPLDEGKGDYRMIPESIILGRLDYESESTKDWLVTELLQPSMSVVHQAENVLKQADVIRKDQHSLTMSGA